RGKPPGEPVFPLHHETAKAIRVDLEAAGIPYSTEEGVADFHSLRTYYVSALVRSGASISEIGRLARHAKPETTLKHYPKPSLHDIRSAVEASPDWAPASTGPSETPAATGTEGKHIGIHIAAPLPHLGDGLGREQSDAGGMAGTASDSTPNANPPEPL